ncbi:hypothetical protein VP01_993g4 [Puccinia sorghi]|uniref:Uncharacterized protein n=1 Tax=Puccinia sorghi TaxID=27349 RepID=A0A0L6U5C2_9BASI|nr:hypothetical protein VP01_993g4 [Puccinia sorghi]
MEALFGPGIPAYSPTMLHISLFSFLPSWNIGQIPFNSIFPAIIPYKLVAAGASSLAESNLSIHPSDVKPSSQSLLYQVIIWCFRGVELIPFGHFYQLRMVEKSNFFNLSPEIFPSCMQVLSHHFLDLTVGNFWDVVLEYITSQVELGMKLSFHMLKKSCIYFAHSIFLEGIFEFKKTVKDHKENDVIHNVDKNFSTPTGPITPDNPIHRILTQPTQLSKIIQICFAAWLSTNLMEQFMILLQRDSWRKNKSLVWVTWKANQISSGSQSSLFSFLEDEPLPLPLSPKSVPKYSKATVSSFCLFHCHFIIAKVFFLYLGGGYQIVVVELQRISTELGTKLTQIRLELCTTYNQHTTGISYVYDHVKRKKLHVSAMETALVISLCETGFHEVMYPNEIKPYFPNQHIRHRLGSLHYGHLSFTADCHAVKRAKKQTTGVQCPWIGNQRERQLLVLHKACLIIQGTNVAQGGCMKISIDERVREEQKSRKADKNIVVFICFCLFLFKRKLWCHFLFGSNGLPFEMNLKCSFPSPFLCLFSFFSFNCSLYLFREYSFFECKWNISKWILSYFIPPIACIYFESKIIATTSMTKRRNKKKFQHNHLHSTLKPPSRERNLFAIFFLRLISFQDDNKFFRIGGHIDDGENWISEWVRKEQKTEKNIVVFICFCIFLYIRKSWCHLLFWGNVSPFAMNLKSLFPFPFLCLFSFLSFNCSLFCFREYNFFDWEWNISKYFNFHSTSLSTQELILVFLLYYHVCYSVCMVYANWHVTGHWRLFVAGLQREGPEGTLCIAKATCRTQEASALPELDPGCFRYDCSHSIHSIQSCCHSPGGYIYPLSCRSLHSRFSQFLSSEKINSILLNSQHTFSPRPHSIPIINNPFIHCCQVLKAHHNQTNAQARLKRFRRSSEEIQVEVTQSLIFTSHSPLILILFHSFIDRFLLSFRLVISFIYLLKTSQKILLLLAFIDSCKNVFDNKLLHHTLIINIISSLPSNGSTETVSHPSSTSLNSLSLADQSYFSKKERKKDYNFLPYLDSPLMVQAWMERGGKIDQGGPFPHLLVGGQDLDVLENERADQVFLWKHKVVFEFVFRFSTQHRKKKKKQKKKQANISIPKKKHKKKYPASRREQIGLMQGEQISFILDPSRHPSIFRRPQHESIRFKKERQKLETKNQASEDWQNVLLSNTGSPNSCNPGFENISHCLGVDKFLLTPLLLLPSMVACGAQLSEELCADCVDKSHIVILCEYNKVNHLEGTSMWKCHHFLGLFITEKKTGWDKKSNKESLQKELAQMPAVDIQHAPAKLSSKLHLFACVGVLALSLYRRLEVRVTTEASWEFLQVNCRQCLQRPWKTCHFIRQTVQAAHHRCKQKNWSSHLLGMQNFILHLTLFTQLTFQSGVVGPSTTIFIFNREGIVLKSKLLSTHFKITWIVVVLGRGFTRRTS